MEKWQEINKRKGSPGVLGADDSCTETCCGYEKFNMVSSALAHFRPEAHIDLLTLAFPSLGNPLPLHSPSLPWHISRGVCDWVTYKFPSLQPPCSHKSPLTHSLFPSHCSSVLIAPNPGSIWRTVPILVWKSIWKLVVGFVQTSSPSGKTSSYKLAKPGMRGFSCNARYFGPCVFLLLCL